MPPEVLADDAARRAAISVHDRTLLVEAGAGSGKTAVMAGRIAAILASGVAPKALAAVTFTELAASELLSRVREVVSELCQGVVPVDLRVAFPDGLQPDQREQLQAAQSRIDEMTCSTIHGFCQVLIKPYPAEADIDPGASVMDRDQADLAFLETRDAWLRDRLDQGEGELLTELVLQSPERTVGLVTTVLDHMRKRRGLTVDAPPALEPLARAFQEAAADFLVFASAGPVQEEETAGMAQRFAEMAERPAVTQAPQDPAALVALLLERPHGDLCTATGSFRAYRKKGKWGDAAKRAGLSKADADRLNLRADELNSACCTRWSALLSGAAARVLAELVDALQPVLGRLRTDKRATALLDFDDVIYAARDLLRDHDEVRQALGQRFTHVLVDEFQDTDPVQIEIFWRLCGDPPSSDSEDWALWRLRPGALFLVGDPKQAIYRFRGADVAAYVSAREAVAAQMAEAVLSISTNFRSCAPILTYVNARFSGPLSVERGQPGFTALDSFHAAREGAVCVAALDVAAADENGAATAEQQRDAEAEAVADLCARLIGSEAVLDRRSGALRPCRPGDIALLAPTSSELWRYEEALERRGVPVATQAGKGLFRRQEIQDLIALTRSLADPRDTLAFGALLRGPLVGLSDEALLDLVWSLPRDPEAPDDLPRLRLGIETTGITDARARGAIERLQALRRRINSTTPYDLLSQAIDVFRVRPLLMQRHAARADRALANVDLFLSLSRAFAVRGLRAFSEMMTAAWDDEARAIEGRPDAQEEAVALYTMHAAKGLEWPIVAPINTMTQVRSADSAVTDRRSGRFYCPVFDVRPTGYEAAREDEKAELERERVRLWYVAATRARELLVLPRLDVDPKSSAWVALVDLGLSELPRLEIDHLPPELPPQDEAAPNTQSRERFALEAAAVADQERRILWRAPSRDEGMTGPVLAPAEATLVMNDGDSGFSASDEAGPLIRGGRTRGTILHKLVEEVLTGEVDDDPVSLGRRADALIRSLGETPATDPAAGLSSDELASCVTRSLALPQVVALRPRLLPEFSVYASQHADSVEDVTAGVADAVALDGNAVDVVIDWKSDIDPSNEALEHYIDQVSAYLEATAARAGLIVLMTSGRVIEVASRALA